MFIKVWCEYDICGSFGGNNDQAVFEVSDSLSSDQVDELVESNFKDLFDEVKDDNDETFLGTGLLSWCYISISKLGE